MSNETTRRARSEPLTSRSGVRSVNHSATQENLYVDIGAERIKEVKGVKLWYYVREI